MSRGRKSSQYEFSAIQGYKDVLPKFFKVLNEMLDSEVKTDRLEAMKIAKGGVEKFLPTILGGDSENPLAINIIKYGEQNANIAVPVSATSLPNTTT